MIIVGGAVGLARGLEDGMETVGQTLAGRIRRWIDPAAAPDEQDGDSP